MWAQKCKNPIRRKELYGANLVLLVPQVLLVCRHMVEVKTQKDGHQHLGKGRWVNQFIHNIYTLTSLKQTKIIFQNFVRKRKQELWLVFEFIPSQYCLAHLYRAWFHAWLARAHLKLEAFALRLEKRKKNLHFHSNEYGNLPFFLFFENEQ